MRWTTPCCDAKPSKLDRLSAWHRWFAWHPIHIGGQTVWLEFVERRGVGAEEKSYSTGRGGRAYYIDVKHWEYRLPS